MFPQVLDIAFARFSRHLGWKESGMASINTSRKGLPRKAAAHTSTFRQLKDTCHYTKELDQLFLICDHMYEL